MGNVTLGKRFRWVHRCRPEDFRRQEKVNRRILISAQFNISPHYSFMVQIKSPCRYVLVYYEAVRSAILATAWLLIVGVLVFSIKSYGSQLRRVARSSVNPLPALVPIYLKPVVWFLEAKNEFRRTRKTAALTSRSRV